MRVNAEWTTYDVPFNRLQQGGWGAEARFDPARLLSLGFSVDPKDLPVDVWVDDIEFIPAPSGPVQGDARVEPTVPVQPAAAPPATVQTTVSTTP